MADNKGKAAGKGTGAEGMSDAKAKMREALARKKEQDHLTAEGRRNTGQVQGSEVTGGRRMFRRKSGG
jgi:hypothetical protein